MCSQLDQMQEYRFTSQIVWILLNPANRLQLEAIVSDHNRPLKHEMVREIMNRVSRWLLDPVSRWQQKPQ